MYHYWLWPDTSFELCTSLALIRDYLLPRTLCSDSLTLARVEVAVSDDPAQSYKNALNGKAVCKCAVRGVDMVFDATIRNPECFRRSNSEAIDPNADVSTLKKVSQRSYSACVGGL